MPIWNIATYIHIRWKNVLCVSFAARFWIWHLKLAFLRVQTTRHWKCCEAKLAAKKGLVHFKHNWKLIQTLSNVIICSFRYNFISFLSTWKGEGRRFTKLSSVLIFKLSHFYLLFYFCWLCLSISNTFYWLLIRWRCQINLRSIFVHTRPQAYKKVIMSNAYFHKISVCLVSVKINSVGIDLVEVSHQSRSRGWNLMETASQNIAYADWQHPSNSANGFTANLHRAMNRDGDGQRETPFVTEQRGRRGKNGEKMNLGSG